MFCCQRNIFIAFILWFCNGFLVTFFDRFFSRSLFLGLITRHGLVIIVELSCCCGGSSGTWTCFTSWTHGQGLMSHNLKHQFLINRSHSPFKIIESDKITTIIKAKARHRGLLTASGSYGGHLSNFEIASHFLTLFNWLMFLLQGTKWFMKCFWIHIKIEVLIQTRQNVKLFTQLFCLLEPTGRS